MQTIKKLLLFFGVSAIMTGCARTSFKKTPGGMPYKIFRSKDTQQVFLGSFIKLSFTQKVNDSVVFSSMNGLPVYLAVNNQMPQRYDVSELWTSLHAGDSVVATQMMDTFIKRAPERIPPQFKKGDRIITCLKVLAVFPTDSAYITDEKKVREVFLGREIKEVETWLANRQVQTERTPSGAFVQLISPGTGNLIDSGKYVTINYTGMGWTGKKFDSNTDSSFHHTQPFSFVAGRNQMIKGFDEAILMMRNGAKAKVYIPSLLGYGASPPIQGVKPYENLIFDVEITGVQDKEPPPPTMPTVKKVDTTQRKNR